MCHRSRFVVSVLLGVVLVAVTVGDSAALRAQGPLLLPLRITARVAHMQNQPSGASAQLEIDITRWSDPKEREQLIATALGQGGQSALRQALQAMPFHGHMSVPQWRGLDPHNVRLGWDLRYTSSTALDDGGQRITIATDRYVGFWEARDGTPIDYPFTVIEIRFDKKGRGSGKIAAAARLDFDRNQNQMALANYAGEPIKLDKVTLVGPRKGKS